MSKQSQNSPKSKAIKIFKWIFSYLPLSDGSYLLIRFWLSNKRRLNLKTPVTFFEKLNWLRLHRDYQQYHTYVDKYAVREYVKNKVGEKNLIEIYGVYERAEDIDFQKLPNQFVLKANHGSNMTYFCHDKSTIDEDQVRKICNKWLKIDYSKTAREANYRGIQPRILCERLLVDVEGKIPRDYKFFCSHGRVKAIQVDIDRFTNHTRNFYDSQWNVIPIRMIYPNCKTKIKKPIVLEEMIRLAETLSSDFTFVRVDLYEESGHIYFGELTFTPEAGLAELSFRDDGIMGTWIEF